MKLQCLLTYALAAIACVTVPVLAGQVTQEQRGQMPDGQGANYKADSEIQPVTLQAGVPPASEAAAKAAKAAEAAAEAAEAAAAAARAKAERNCPKPVFPEESLRAGHKGSVEVAIFIDADGAVADTRIAKSSGFPLLDAAGISAISKCRFKAVDENNKPAPVWHNVTYHFLY